VQVADLIFMLLIALIAVVAVAAMGLMVYAIEELWGDDSEE